MAGDTTPQSLLQGAFQDAGRAPERVDRGGEKEGKRGGGGQTGKPDGREDNGTTQQNGGEGTEDSR